MANHVPGWGERLSDTVSQIPGENGWWHDDSEQVFVDHAIQLANAGFSEADIGEILRKLYRAVADEYSV